MTEVRDNWGMRLGFVAVLAGMFSCVVQADVAATYEMNVKPGEMVPEALIEELNSGPVKYPMTVRYAVKGNRFISGYGGIDSIGSLTNDEMLLIDRANQRYARTTFPEWVKAGEWQMGNVPEETGKLLSKIKVESSSKVSGHQRLILGLNGIETSGLMSFEMPSATGSSLGRLDVRLSVWNADPKSIAKGGGHLQELADAMTRIMANYNFGKAFTGIFGVVPSASSSMTVLSNALANPGALLLEFKGGMYVPELAEAAKAAGRSAAEIRTLSAPLLEIVLIVKKISGAAIAESEFVVPEGFGQVEASEILRAMAGQK